MAAVSASPNAVVTTTSLAHRAPGEASAPVTTIVPATDGSGDLPDIRLGASCPALFFAIPLHTEALVTIHVQELNSASRCALLLSPSDPHPSEETAVWRLTSPNPVKTLVVHPADDNYTMCAASGSGALYLSLRYLETNGCTSVRLAVRVQPSFYSVWYRREVRYASRASDAARQSCTTSLASTALKKSLPAGTAAQQSSTLECDAAGSHEDFAPRATRSGAAAPTPTMCSSLYIGHWLGGHYHGRGVCFYAAAAADGTPSTTALLLLQTMYERRSLPWSALSLPENPTLDGTVLDAAFIAKITGLTDTREAQRATVPDSSSPPARAPAACGQKSEDCVKARSWNEEGAEESNSDSSSSSSKESSLVDTWQVIRAPIYDEGLEAYDGDWQHGRKDGHGVYQWADRAYVGFWKAGKRHGYGELRCQSGAYYRGEWLNDMRHGHGEALLVPEGNVYTGEWREGLREGIGSLRYPNGVVVTGHWAAGLLAADAEVTAVYPDGSTYVGAWGDDCRHGVGRCTDAKGCVHEHQWVNDRREGSGRILLRNGVRFDGQWAGDALVSGSYGFPNGDVYQGDWDAEKDVRTGQGSCRSRNGDSYEGEWHDDQRHGQGTMHYAGSGAVYSGGWAGNQPSGEGRLQDAEGIYVGSFERGLRCGYGVQTGPDGSVYKGHWRSNYRAGHGTQYDATQDVTYTGIFLHDRLQGEGASVKHHLPITTTATSATTEIDHVGLGEEVYSGTWLDGLEQGRGTLRLPTGDVMRGVWHRGKQQDGSVELQSAGGGVYVGDWCGGQRSGHGTQVAADGATVYEGEWRQDKPHGRGRLTRANGESVECDWKDGGMVDGSTGTIVFLDGSVYVGEVCQGVPHGEGTLTYPDSTVFHGTFTDGVYNL